MARRAVRKTDTGTVILHWTLVALLLIAVGTGLRIALDSPRDMHWLHSFDALLPQDIVWTAHIPVGAALIALAIAYSIYLARTGLFRRVKPELGRLTGIAGRARQRLAALNLLLYWALFAALGVVLVTGCMLYIGHGGWAAEAHYLATWAILAYVPAHVLVHYAIGGKSQLMRVLNPSRLAASPTAFDPFEMIASMTSRDKPDAAQRSAARPESPRMPHRPRIVSPRAGETPRAAPALRVVRAHPLVTAIAGGLAFLAFLLSLDTVTRDTLEVNQIAESEKPKIDGDLSEPVWRMAKVVRVPTQQGGNLDGKGQSFVEIRAVHDGANAYLSFVWEDPTRSIKHLPMQKRADGWYVLHEGFDKGDATAYFEDKFAVLMLAAYVLIPGDRTFHAGRQPLTDKPATFSGRGMHYTTAPGAYADMWQWRAASGGLLGWVDDAHFGPPTEPTEAQLRGQSAYKGGFAPDPGSAFHALNFDERGPGGYDFPVTPKRLPKDLAKSTKAMGKIDLDPNMGEPENGVWWLTDAESVPYSAEADARIPAGAIIPGVLVSGSYGGDRAHIRGNAKWSSGRWTLETVRRLDTGSKFDAPIASGTYMRVAVFDHTQSRHTRFIRPIRLEVIRCANPVECRSTTRDLQLSGASSF